MLAVVTVVNDGGDARGPRDEKKMVSVLSGKIPRYLQCFLDSTYSKNTGIYAVFSMLQEAIFPCKSQITLYITLEIASTWLPNTEAHSSLNYISRSELTS